MFWRFGGYANISTLDTILDKPDVTVEELLDESDLIQELKQQNSKLVEFLREEPVLKKLLGYVVADDLPVTSEEKQDDGKTEEEKSVGISFFGKGKSRSRSKSVHQHNGDGETEQDKKEAQRKKYAYVACEVLSAEVWSITEAMLENREHLEEFWGYMRRPAQLDPLQVGYFTKVNEALLDKKTEEMMAFFKSLDGIVPAMLQHVDCPMVMDLLLKIISLEKHEGGAGIVGWLQSQDLIPLLLANLSPEHSSATQTSAGDFLKAIITISANATTQDQSVIGPNELTRQLVSEKCINMLISDMLRGGNPLTVGVGIIIEVIRKNNSDYDLDNQVGPEPKTSDPIYLGTLLRAFAQHVPDFMHLVRSPSAKKADLKVAFGSKIEPLGFDRFKTCELMAELLHCSNMGLLNERGAEEEVRKRDAERERLKADGRLATPKGPVSPNQESSHDEFASSVDSHGFHHAERPNDDDISNEPEEIKKLEVQNASDEDGFEKVNAPSDDLPDEVTFDDLDEKLEQTGLPALEKVDKREPAISPQSPEIPAPLSPRKQNLQPKQGHLFDPPPTEAADSPTTSVTDQISKLDVDEDTVMTEFGEEPSATRKQNSWSLIQQFEEQPLSMPTDDDDTTAELDRDLAHRPEDKPAPLFAKKESLGQSTTTVGDDRQHIDQSVATIQAGDEGADDSERSPYESESNGRPVVGDALKMQFVEHQVVPTILVSVHVIPGFSKPQDGTCAVHTHITCLQDFFFRFPWNNFLHNVVYDVVQQVFNGTLDRGYNRALAFALFTPAIAAGQSGAELGLISSKDITDRILDGQLASEKSQAAKGMRLGYMGHLTLIAEEVCKFGNRHPPEHLDQTILDRVSREEWVQYVEGTLAETRDKDNAVLGGVRPENAIQRPMAGLGGGFSSNAANALASAGMTPQDSLAMSEGTVGQSFEINSGSMLSGFGDGGDDDEDMLEVTGERRLSATDAFSEDEQVGELSFEDVDMDYR
nr:extragenic suppressor of kinetochore protein 1 [Quercus suber]